MAIQLISPIHNSVPPDREQFQLLTLWKELSPEQQRQLAQRLAELIQRIQMPGSALQEKSHEDT